MVKTILIFLILFNLIKISYSQEVYSDFWDGVAYFKVKVNSEVVIPEFTNPKEYDKLYDFPKIQEIIDKYEVTELVKPFITNCPKVQNTYRLKFNKHEGLDNILKKFHGFDYIAYIEKSPMYKSMLIPNDEFLSEQYYLYNIQAFDAWEIAESNYKPTVAIVDDAVQIDHPDLAANIWVNPNEIENGEDSDGNGFIDDIHGYDIADNNNDPGPPDTPGMLGETMWVHGTHCAGIAGAVTNNEIGIAGVSNNNIQIIGVKINSSDSFFPPMYMQKGPEGVDYAVQANADIISMSFGGPEESQTILNVINAGVEKGIIFVASAGNSGTESLFYPAAYQQVIAVGATDSDDLLTDFSQRGLFIDIMAPGKDIYSTLVWSEPYGAFDGTSMACPMVAGGLALLKSHRPEASREQIINCLYAGCDDIYSLNPNYIGKLGAGRMNLYNSILCLNDPVSFMQQKVEDSINIFPNPAENHINILFNKTKERNIKITNLTGQVVYSINSNQDLVNIDVSSLNAGLYIVVVNEGDNIISKKILVE